MTSSFLSFPSSLPSSLPSSSFTTLNKVHKDLKDVHANLAHTVVPLLMKRGSLLEDVHTKSIELARDSVKLSHTVPSKLIERVYKCLHCAMNFFTCNWVCCQFYSFFSEDVSVSQIIHV